MVVVVEGWGCAHEACGENPGSTFRAGPGFIPGSEAAAHGPSEAQSSLFPSIRLVAFQIYTNYSTGAGPPSPSPSPSLSLSLSTFSNHCPPPTPLALQFCPRQHLQLISSQERGATVLASPLSIYQVLVRPVGTADCGVSGPQRLLLTCVVGERLH